MESSAIDSRTPAARLLRRVAAAALAAALAGCATAPTGPLLLHPVPPALEKYALVQGAIVYSGPGFSVAARPWDYRLVAEECRRSGEPCPFGDDEAAAGRFLFFRLRLDNQSTRTLVFNPMRASLLREAEVPLVAVQNSDLFAFAGDDTAGAEARGKAFRRMSFDTTATVRAGETIERYLVFPSPEEGARQVVLELSDLWLDTKSFDVQFAFEAFPGK
jgi:hypothetical protein